MKTLYSLSAVLLFALATFSVKAQDLPKPSPHAEVSQTVGLTNISIEYSRPGVKERDIFGGLVPFGKVWRTGANKATKITFDTPVTFGGEKVEAGSYAIFTIPSKDEWTVILNTTTESWGAGDYSEENDVARIEVESMDMPHMENMMFYFDELKDGSANLILRWAETGISIPVTVDYKKLAMQNIEAEFKKYENKYRLYDNAADFYIANNMDIDKAVEYAKKSVEMNPKFWNMRTLSEAYAAAGNYKDAIKTAEKSMKLAEEAEYEPYIKINKENIKKWKSKM
ncbi:DUF2911 domain-containing protein [Salibacter halophilus]|uniref:DUF2911 domain-containing protein n=1 Tax=Salibacter halophilus TaxID=1803916 RepID=A0A6N6M433_9FLAO|nr:DUF2911 domain-containing protein [Salibacter halophilus]KAB1064038.1 DUF2911 domain-containing protein [Salibacter halophilus]